MDERQQLSKLAGCEKKRDGLKMGAEGLRSRSRRYLFNRIHSIIASDIKLFPIIQQILQRSPRKVTPKIPRRIKSQNLSPPIIHPRILTIFIQNLPSLARQL